MPLFGHILRKGRAYAVSIAGYIPAVDRTAVCLQRYFVCIDRPLGEELLVADIGAADCVNLVAGKIRFFIPAVKRIAFPGYIRRQGRALAVGIAGYFPAVDRAALCI